MIYTHVLPTGPLGVTSPADTPQAGTDVSLMLRQMETLMQKLAPLAANLPGQPNAQGASVLEVRAPVMEAPAKPAISQRGTGILPVVHGWDLPAASAACLRADTHRQTAQAGAQATSGFAGAATERPAA